MINFCIQPQQELLYPEFLNVIGFTRIIAETMPSVLVEQQTVWYLLFFQCFTVAYRIERINHGIIHTSHQENRRHVFSHITFQG